MLEMVVTAGTGKTARLNGYTSAGKSGTAEFGLRDAHGRLPYHTWFVGFLPKDLTVAPGSTSAVEARANALMRKTDSPLAVIGFAYASNSFGNIGAEMVKYFLQLHYQLNVDLRRPDLLQRGNFYGGT